MFEIGQANHVLGVADIFLWCIIVSLCWAVACAFTFEAGRKSGRLEGELETLRQWKAKSASGSDAS